MAAAVADWAALLPTGTCLAYTVLTSTVFSTSADTCSNSTEKVLLMAIIGTLAIICFLLCFTDSINVGDKLLYGWLSPHGLRLFEGSLRTLPEEVREQMLQDLKDPDEPYFDQYKLGLSDLLRAAICTTLFLVLTALTRPAASCFFPNIPPAILRAAPICLTFMVAVFIFVTPVRGGRDAGPTWVRYGVGSAHPGHTMAGGVEALTQRSTDAVQAKLQEQQRLQMQEQQRLQQQQLVQQQQQQQRSQQQPQRMPPQPFAGGPPLHTSPSSLSKEEV